MKILVTGAAGYLGSVLVPLLLEQGHRVVAMDNFMYRQRSLAGCCHDERLTIVGGDVRGGTVALWSSCDAVVALAAVVGAAACSENYEGAVSTNTGAIEELCKSLSRDKLLIYPNTNSGYASGGQEQCTEESELRPASLYGRTKVAAEQEVLQRERSVSLRFATLFGMSPRMRMDLMVNDFVYRAVRDRYLALFEGKFRRNFLHVRDAARTILYALENAGAALPFGVYNAGLSSANITKVELCRRIRRQVADFRWTEEPLGTDPDQRDYVVSNAKLEATGWLPAYSLEDGIAELIKGYQMPFYGAVNSIGVLK